MHEDGLIYLDNNATTPLDPRVLDAMMPFFKEQFGNAASPHHALGRAAHDAVEGAREKVAQAIAADPREIIWTSGATEANNLALRGVSTAKAYATRRKHIVTLRTEHKSVLDPCEHLESQGFEVTYLGVDRNGQLDFDKLDAVVAEDTLLVSAMHGNNETGVVIDLAKIGKLCKERSVLFHSDATQTFGKLAIDVDAFGVDLLSFSAHKVYGPKGVGGLYVRRRSPRVRCDAQILGGGHERDMRSGTLNVPGIVGLGAAAEVAVRDRDADASRITSLRDRFEAGLRTSLDGVEIHTAGAERLAGTCNLSIAGIEAEALIERLPDLALATASACTSAMRQPSYVLGALGLSAEAIASSVRISLGRFTTEAEIERACGRLVEAVRALR